MSYQVTYQMVLKVNVSYLLMSLLRKFLLSLQSQSLIRILKSFIRLHLDHGDIVYDRAFNESLHKNHESIQYNAATTIPGALRGTSSEKPFQELSLESLKPRCWLRKLCSFYEIFHQKSSSCLFQLIPPNNNVSNKIPSFKIRPFFHRSLFSSSDNRMK